MIKQPIPTALNTSTYTAITLGSDHAFGFAVCTSDASAFYLAVDAAGTGEALFPGPASPSWGHYEPALATVLWAKAVTGTPDLNLLPGRSE